MIKRNNEFLQNLPMMFLFFQTPFHYKYFQEVLKQRFEYTFELGWKVLQDLLKYKGYEFVQGPNGTLQKAFEDGLIADHDGWRRMAKARVTTSHTYNEGDAIEIVRNIYDEYSHLLQRLDDKLNEEKLRLEMNTLF